MKYKFACIYSSDGFDNDVLLNQIDLLRQLNYKFIYSDKVLSCDLLIVLRAEKDVFPFQSVNKNNIKHALFIDYSGQDVHIVFEKCEHPSKYLITSRPKIIGNNIFQGSPFISINRWIHNRKTDSYKKYDIVHIGHFKKNSSYDGLIQVFNDQVKKHNVDVFGNGWKDIVNAKYYHGHIDVKSVSKIYSESKLAIGIKHPFQRGLAISGRYWHAPLNGCLLLVEDDYMCDEIPGIIKINYEADDIKVISNTYKIDSRNIQVQAINYWTKSNELQLEILKGVQIIETYHSLSDYFSLKMKMIKNNLTLHLNFQKGILKYFLLSIKYFRK